MSPGEVVGGPVPGQLEDGNPTDYTSSSIQSLQVHPSHLPPMVGGRNDPDGRNRHGSVRAV